MFDLPALKRLLQRAERAGDRPRRGRDRLGLALRLVASLRLHRDVHVRGRHAAGGAACAGALARPRPAAGAARPGGAARADRPRRAGGGGGVAAAVPARSGAPLRRAAAARRSARGRVRRGARRDPRGGAARDPESGSPARSGSRPPRTPGATATRSARCRPPGSRRSSSRRCPTRSSRSCAASPAVAGRSRVTRRAPGSAWTWSRSSAGWRAPTRSSAASCGPAGASASGVIRRCCGDCAARRWRRFGARSSPRSRRRWDDSSPAWHGIDRRASLPEALIPLQGLALPVSLWESGGAAETRALVPAGAARSAVRLRRARVGRRGARSRGGLLPGRRGRARAAVRGAADGGRGARRAPRRARRRSALLERPAGGHRG